MKKITPHINSNTIGSPFIYRPIFIFTGIHWVNNLVNTFFIALSRYARISAITINWTKQRSESRSNGSKSISRAKSTMSLNRATGDASKTDSVHANSDLVAEKNDLIAAKSNLIAAKGDSVTAENDLVAGKSDLIAAESDLIDKRFCRICIKNSWFY